MVGEEDFLLNAGSVSERVESSEQSDVTAVGGDSSGTDLGEVEILGEVRLGLLVSVVIHIEDGESVELGVFSELLLDDLGGRSAVLASLFSPLQVSLLANASSVLDLGVLVQARETAFGVLGIASAALRSAKAD